MKKFIFPVLGALFLVGCEEINFACDETSARGAADFINENYEQYGGALELTDAKLVKSEPNHLFCRAKANVHTEYINYELVRKSNGDIYVMVNPLGDIIDETIKELDTELNTMDLEFNDFD